MPALRPPDGLPSYRVLTGVDDASFCHRVSDALALGYRLHEGPAVTFTGEAVVVAQALSWPSGPAASPFTVRRGTAEDAPILLRLFDEAIRWMVRRGQTAQWGSTPFSELPERVSSVDTWAASGGLRICERDGRPAAAMVFGEAQPYVAPATEPELYVQVLVGSREPFARGAGAHLLAAAEHEARALGRRLLRVDCYAGNDGALVRFYESCGFQRTDTFTVRDWPGVVLSRRVR